MIPGIVIVVSVVEVVLIVFGVWYLFSIRRERDLYY